MLLLAALELAVNITAFMVGSLETTVEFVRSDEMEDVELEKFRRRRFNFLVVAVSSSVSSSVVLFCGNKIFNSLFLLEESLEMPLLNLASVFLDVDVLETIEDVEEDGVRESFFVLLL